MFVRTLDEHRQAVDALLAPVKARLDARPQLVHVHSTESFDRVLVRPVLAIVPVPTFDNSQMDGYAVFSEDLAGASADQPVTLPIGVTTAAGDTPVTHVRRMASPVMTGAAIPVGADAVVPVEGTAAQEFPRLVRHGEGEPVGDVTFTAPVDVGTFVRRQAEDIEVGSTVLRSGTRLTPSRIGAAAAVGVTAVEVRPRLRILLCTTGDEILGIGRHSEHHELSDYDSNQGSGDGSGHVSNHGSGHNEPAGFNESSAPGEPSATADDSGIHQFQGTGESTVLRAGQICDANTPMLHAAMYGLGAEISILRSGDNPDEFREALLARVDGYDLVITTGGISRGAYEVVRSALEPFGVEFGTVAIQPGGPQGMGVIPEESSRENTDDFSGAAAKANAGAMNEFAAGENTGASLKANRTVPILCFPGNPVSAILSFELFLAPTLRELSGLPTERPGAERLLAHDVVSPEHKHQLRRGMIDADGKVVVSGPGSHLIGDLADADVLVHLPAGTTHAGAGTPVHTWRFND